MVFKSDRQRKAVMAKLKGGTRSNVRPEIILSRAKAGKFRIDLIKISPTFAKVKVFRGKKEVVTTRSKTISEAELDFKDEVLARGK